MSKTILCKVVKNTDGSVQFYGTGWDYSQLRFDIVADYNFETFLHPEDPEQFANCPEPDKDAHIIRIIYSDGTIESFD